MKYQYKKQQGFSILAIILVIVAVVVAIGIWALSGQSNISNTSNSSLDIAVESLINDSISIKMATNAFYADKGQSAIIDAGLFTFEHPAISPKLIRSGATVYEGKWVINPSNFYALNIAGNNYSTDVTLMVGGITDVACKNINNKINGTALTVNIPVNTNANTSSDAVTPDSTKNFTYNYFYLPNMGGVNGWSKGCFSVKGIADNNVYFFVLQAN